MLGCISCKMTKHQSVQQRMTMKPCLQLIRTMKWVGAASIFGCQPGAELTEEDHEVWIVDQGASFIGAYGLGDGEYRSTVLELEEGVEASALVELNGQIVLTDFSSGDVLSYNRTERGLEEVVWENGAEGTRPRLEEPCAIDVVDGSLWVLGNDSRNVLAFTGAGADNFGSEISWEVCASGPTTLDGCADVNGNAICDGSELNLCPTNSVCWEDPGAACTDHNHNGLCDAAEQSGCTYAHAPNFNPSATMDDGSCLSPCFGDFNNDGLIDWYVTSIDTSGGNGNKLYINQGNHRQSHRNPCNS